MFRFFAGIFWIRGGTGGFLSLLMVDGLGSVFFFDLDRLSFNVFVRIFL